MNALTTQEQSELERLEAVIDRGLRTFYQVGAALIGIRDGRLYRSTHKAFEAYCEDRWGFGRDRAYQLIAAAEVHANLKTADNCRQLPANEHQASMLVDLTPDAQIVVWKQAVDTAPRGRLTAAHVAKVVEEAVGRPPGAEPGETHPDVVAGLAALSPDARRDLMARAQEETVSHRPARQVGGDQAAARLAKCRSLLRKALTEARALGGEADAVIEAVEAAVEAAEAFIL